MRRRSIAGKYSSYAGRESPRAAAQWEERYAKYYGFVLAGGCGTGERKRGERDDLDQPRHQVGRKDRRRAGVQGPGWDCTGKNVSPALSWSGAPKGAKSFAVSIFDSDAPTGSGFWHWWVANIAGRRDRIAEGAGSGTGLPASAVQVRNDFGSTGYGGPCPPKGMPHHYHITVYALDTDKLDVDKDASPAVVGFNVHGHTLAKATLVGLYGR